MKLDQGLDVLEVSTNVFGRDMKIYLTLIYNDDEALLIDAGLPNQGDKIIDAINKTDSNFDKVNRIIVTHQDIDHIGSLNYLKENSNHRIKTYAFEDEIKFITGEKLPHKLAKLEENKDILSKEINGRYKFFKNNFKLAFSQIDKGLGNKDVIDIYGGIEVIHTPGHTLGHICLYLKKYKTLISGDILSIEDGKLLLTREKSNFDHESAKESVKVLKGYDIERVITSHYGVIDKNIKEFISKL